MEVVFWVLVAMIGGSLLFASMFVIGMLNDLRRSRKFNRALKRLIREERDQP